VHPLIACLCNSRIVQPANAGDGPSWPLLLIWGGQLALVAAAAAYWFLWRPRRRAAAGRSGGDPGPATATFAGAEAVLAEERAPGLVNETVTGPPGDAGGPADPPGVETAETAQVR